MKLLYILNSTGVGGAEVSIKRMVEYRYQDADVVTLWQHVNSQEKFWRFNSTGRVYNLTNKPLGISSVFRVIKELKVLIETGGYTVIQSQLKGADILLGLTLVMFPKLKVGKRIIYSLRNSYGFYYEGGFVNWFVGLVHKYLVRTTGDAIISVSNQNQEQFRNAFGEKYHVILNALDLSVFSTKEIQNLKELEILKICMVGNIKYRKGYDRIPVLIQNLRKYTNQHIIIRIAGGLEDQTMSEWLRNLSIENTTITLDGKVSDINAFLLQADIFISLSRDEGLPISVLEALASGLPVAVSDIPAHSLLLGKNLAQEVCFSSEQEAASIINNIINKPAHDIVEQGRKLIESHYSIERLCNQYGQIYTDEA